MVQKKYIPSAKLLVHEYPEARCVPDQQYQQEKGNEIWDKAY